jgi:hypothetical protein
LKKLSWLTRETNQDRLTLRVTQSGVVLKNTDPFRASRRITGNHKPGIEESRERSTPLRHLSKDRRGAPLLNPLKLSARDARRRTHRTHPTGIRALIVISQTLIIVRGSERNNITSVTREDATHLNAIEELLYNHPLSVERPEKLLECGIEVLGVSHDENALARRETVGL